MKNEEIRKLINIAIEAREKAYAPYSNFKVGAAVLTEKGNIYTGCNIENASYGLSICAERVAIFKAVSEGERNFKMLVVVADTDQPVSPCGACRQVMIEFGDYDVVLANLKGEFKIYKVSQLLPENFDKENLK